LNRLGDAPEEIEKEYRSGDHIWNPVCDLSNPSDDVINVIDLDIFAASWLEGTQ